jgi:MoaA/NifB/PqqE/SkfB family radical SAM enzyme
MGNDGLIERLATAVHNPGLLSLVRPEFRFAKVKVTNNCNSRCITCDYWQHKFTNELTLDEIRAVLRDLRSLGVAEVMFTGGEPTIRPELPDCVRAAREVGFEGIGLTTNGLSINPDKIDRLLDAGLTEIVLSLEGLEFHDEVRGVPGNARKIIGHLAYLRTVRGRLAGPIAVKLAMTLMGKNLDEVPGMVDLAREYEATLFLNLIDRGTYFFGITPVTLFEIPDKPKFHRLIDWLIDVKQREPDLLGNTVSSLEYARRYFDDPKQSEVPCHLGYVGIDVDANGDVFSNCWGLPPVGNIRKTPLREIVSSRGYLERCGAMYRKECPGCSCGYILNLAYHKPSVDQDEAGGIHHGRFRVGYSGTKRSWAGGA